MESKMGMVFMSGPMDLNMKVIGRIILLRDKENTYGVMA